VTRKLAQTLAQRHVLHCRRKWIPAVAPDYQKKLNQDEITGKNAKAGGLSALKLYGMVGIPGEEPADVDQTVAMMRDIKSCSRITLDTGCSTFVHAVSVAG